MLIPNPSCDQVLFAVAVPTVIDRTIQQAIAQQLIPIYEPLFIETSYGYRPNKSAKDAVLKVKEYGRKRVYLCGIIRLIKVFRYPESRIADKSTEKECKR